MMHRRELSMSHQELLKAYMWTKMSDPHSTEEPLKAEDEIGTIRYKVKFDLPPHIVALIKGAVSTIEIEETTKVVGSAIITEVHGKWMGIDFSCRIDYNCKDTSTTAVSSLTTGAASEVFKLAMNSFIDSWLTDFLTNLKAQVSRFKYKIMN